MKAFILAAGRGERMRPLTDHTPKPLLLAGGKPLIVWHLERLAAAGFREVVINHAHLGEQIEAALGDGSQWGLHIRYSPEPPGALETAGGIANALPLLGNEAFLVVNGDIYCDCDFGRFPGQPWQAGSRAIWSWSPIRRTMPAATSAWTANASFTPTVSKHSPTPVSASSRRPSSPTCNAATVMKLRPLLDAAIAAGTLTGERFAGRWVDVGTPQRLAELDKELRDAELRNA